MDSARAIPYGVKTQIMIVPYILVPNGPVGYNVAKGVFRVAKQPLTREKAIVWWIALFVISVFGTAFVIWRWYRGQRLWLGILLYGLLFVCASVPGTRANPDEIKKSIGAGLRTLIVPAPLWALAVAVLELLTLVFLRWDWFWRSPAPLALGVIAGYLWARQEQPPDASASKKDKDMPPPVDLWKV